MKTRLLVLCSLLGAMTIGALAQAPPSFVGTWKLNLAKSRYSPGPPPRSSTVKNEAVENGVKAVNDAIDSEGKATHSEYTARFNGKDYPVTGNPAVDAISLKKVDDRTIDFSMKKGGKVAYQGRTAYSPDGKLRTLTYAGTDAKGQKLEVTAIFERQ